MDQALARALRYLGYRPRSEYEIRKKLAQSGFPAAVVEQTLEKLRSLNYLNDSNFARDWALARVERRGFGPRRIEQELKAKGVAQPLAEEIIREIFRQTDERAQARSLLEKKFKVLNRSDPRSIRRAAAFLERRGYRQEVIAALLRQRLEDC